MTMTAERPTQTTPTKPDYSAPIQTPPTLSVTVQRRDLLAALELPVKATGKGNAPMAYRSVLLKMEAGRLVVGGTDLELEATAKCDAEGEGVALIPAQRLRESIAALPEGPVKISPASLRVLIQGGATQFLLPTTDHRDYAGGIDVPEEAWEIPGSALAPLLKATIVAASTDATMPTITGVFLNGEAGILTLATTDRHRVHQGQERRFRVPDFQAIIPATAVRLLTSGLDPDRCWEVASNRNQLKVSDGETTLITRLIEGKYPAYTRSYLAKDAATTLWTVNADDLLASCRRLLLVARTCKSTERLALEAKKDGDSVRLSAFNETDHAEDRVSATITGDALQIGFSASYLIQALEQFVLLGHSEVRLRFFGAENPAQFEPAAGGENLRFAVGPMRLDINPENAG